MKLNEKEIEELATDDGKLFELSDYDIRVLTDTGDRTWVNVRFYKPRRDQRNNHEHKFSDEDIEKLMQDLEDLSDWRHYRRLKNKLNK